ncbi:hypothetical protein CC80DRAFT_416794 [Byssothecium circinans]|uniref:Hemerythrin-like domain-containing protein n=1 Tax=Byssothecium circinans TaxID=147558 RepID=A0A6A5TSN9_9PLEO|nr:hypothetical protein CC80DRAFT_416794 [Byssothecium circinans]
MPNNQPTTNPPRYNWEREPIPLIPTPYHITHATDQYTRAASEKALVHNALIRALNSIYIRAPHVPITDYPNFMKYCLAAHEALTTYLQAEAEVFIPELERQTGVPGLLRANAEHHRAFSVGIAAWGNWLSSIATRKNNFSPDMCRTLMDDFLPALATHFNDGVAGVLLSRTKTLPVLWANHDGEFEGGGSRLFPQLSGVTGWGLRNMGRVNKEVWVYGTVGLNGRARVLRYAGEGM